jgi:hypothetical protein
MGTESQPLERHTCPSSGTACGAARQGGNERKAAGAGGRPNDSSRSSPPSTMSSFSSTSRSSSLRLRARGRRRQAPGAVVCSRGRTSRSAMAGAGRAGPQRDCAPVRSLAAWRRRQEVTPWVTVPSHLPRRSRRSRRGRRPHRGRLRRHHHPGVLLGEVFEFLDLPGLVPAVSMPKTQAWSLRSVPTTLRRSSMRRTRVARRCSPAPRAAPPGSAITRGCGGFEGPTTRRSAWRGPDASRCRSSATFRTPPPPTPHGIR